MTATFKLSPRYEIRKLSPEHLDWSKAILTHSNIFCSPVWKVLYPDDKAKRAYGMFTNLDYHVLHGITSGHSYGAFDTEYKFKRPESAATGGKLYWDVDNLDATSSELLEQMDFPLVSIALGYDGFHELDIARLVPFINVSIPAVMILFATLNSTDPRGPEAQKPKATGEVIVRNGTSTREDYEGLGLAKGLAHYMMNEKAKEGFKAIQIDSAATAVGKIWGNPPAPFTAEMTCSFETATFEMDGEDGEKMKPFLPADQLCARTIVTLA